MRAYDVRTRDRRAVRHRLGARAAPRVRRRHGHRAGPRRGAARSASWPTTRRHLAGAIDADGADKAARFLQLCDAFDMPIVTLVDTPGMMVGPDVEATALVRHCSRLFVTGANVTVPLVDDRAAQGLRPRRAGDDGRHRSRRRCSAWRGRPASSAGWAWRARCGSATARSSTAIEDPDERERAVPGDGRADVRARQGAQHRHRTSRSTT